VAWRKSAWGNSETERFTGSLQLETNRAWQAAPITQKARARLLRRGFVAWNVRRPGETVATALVVQFWAAYGPWTDLVVSTTPKKVVMTRLLASDTDPRWPHPAGRWTVPDL
jgi:hypothetical protein